MINQRLTIKTIAAVSLAVMPLASQAQSGNEQKVIHSTPTQNPKDMNTTQTQSEQKILVDRFSVPATALSDFTQRMNYNRGLIKSLPGFVRDDVYEMQDEKGNWSIITVATWQNQSSIDQAKRTVQEDYKKSGFNMQQFIQQRNIVLLERGIYQKLEE